MIASNKNTISSIYILLAACLLVCACRKEVNSGIEGPLAQRSGGPNCPDLPEQVVNVLTFGAHPNDGVDDTEAMMLAAAYVNQICSEQFRTVLLIPTGIYDVGVQVPPGGTLVIAGQSISNPGIAYCYKGIDLIRIECCPNVTVRGEGGAHLRLRDGLRYGECGGCNDANHRSCMPNMVVFRHTSCCYLENIELDGNADNAVLGAYCGEGYQEEADGIQLDHTRETKIQRVRTHHCGRDGFFVYDKSQTFDSQCAFGAQWTDGVYVQDLRSEYNGRQGFSWCSGMNIHASNSQFNHTGRGVIHSRAGYGFDMEPLYGSEPLSSGYFESCEFSDNWISGVGSMNHSMIHDVRFYECIIWAVSQDNQLTPPSSIYVELVGGLQFDHCLVYGKIEHAGGTSVGNMNVFNACTISDKAPDGTLASVSIGTALISLGPSDNYVKFLDCRISSHFSMCVYAENFIHTTDATYYRIFQRNNFIVYYEELNCGASNFPTLACQNMNGDCLPPLLYVFRHTELNSNKFYDVSHSNSDMPLEEEYGLRAVVYPFPPDVEPPYNNQHNNSDLQNSLFYVPGEYVGHLQRAHNINCGLSRAIF